MEHIKGFDRQQMVLIPETIEQLIEQDNIVRVIDVFVDSLDYHKLQFNNIKPPADGRPPYHPSDLLKLYIYGYLTSIRSSRKLEKECKRNLEVIWLLKGLKPDHNTISNFRRDNPKAIKKVFRQTVAIAKNRNLIAGVLIAGDSFKLRAQNSKKNNYNQKKIDRHLAYIENKLEEYNKALAEADRDGQRKDIGKEINQQKKRKRNYQRLQKQLKDSGQPQISTTDPDSRQIIIRNNITEVAYNVQTTVDDKHNLPIDYKVTNQNDSKAMGNMVRRAKSILRTDEFTALYDKGYHTGTELAIAQDLGIETLVAVPRKPASSQAPHPGYNVEHFTYDPEKDTYTCLQGQTLTTNGSWYTKYSRSGSSVIFKQYKTKACAECPARILCTTSKNGRMIGRTKHTEYYQKNRENVEAHPAVYKRRQAIVEHPFGTIKRQWGFDHVISKKSMKRAEADVGLIFIAYNLRRLINILGKGGLKAALVAFWGNFSLSLAPFRVIGQLTRPIFFPLVAFQNVCRNPYQLDYIGMNFSSS